MHFPSTFVPIAQPPHHPLWKSLEGDPRHLTRNVTLKEEDSLQPTSSFILFKLEMMKRMLREMHVGHVEGGKSDNALLLKSIEAKIE